LDVFNGLLLAPHLDAMFDQGFITVSDDGAVAVSKFVLEHDRQLLAIGNIRRICAAIDVRCIRSPGI
jgi:hypothetical protein